MSSARISERIGDSASSKVNSNEVVTVELAEVSGHCGTLNRVNSDSRTRKIWIELTQLVDRRGNSRATKGSSSYIIVSTCVSNNTCRDPSKGLGRTRTGCSRIALIKSIEARLSTNATEIDAASQLLTNNSATIQ